MDANMSAKGGKIIGFYLIGLALTLGAEAIRFLLVENRPGPWISMTVAYLAILTLALALAKIIKNNLLYYIVFGIIGLLLEIFWLGQAPNIMAVGILGWLMWFSYWGSIAFIPKLYLQNQLDKVFLAYFIVALAFFSFVFLVLKNTGAPGLFFASLNIIYLRYFLKK